MNEYFFEIFSSFCKVHQTRLKILKHEASIAVAYVVRQILSNTAEGQALASNGIMILFSWVKNIM